MERYVILLSEHIMRVFEDNVEIRMCKEEAVELSRE
jgi:hypothetical protein